MHFRSQHNLKHVRLSGGLGNNLFQIALAYRLVHEFDSSVRFFRISNREVLQGSSLSWDYRKNHLETKAIIKGFGIFERVSAKFVFNRFHESLLTPGGRVRNKLSFNKLSTIETEQDPCWLPSPENFQTIDVLSGYFQNAELIEGLSEDFFDTLVRTLKGMCDVRYVEIANDFDACIQFRRGDYRFHKGSIGQLSESFFLDCIEILNLDPNSAQILVITDDPNACTGLIKNLPKIRILGPSEVGSVTALMILSASRHLVISNSTLAWWGGLLARRSGANVLAPWPWRIQNCAVHGPNKISRGIDFQYVRATFDN